MCSIPVSALLSLILTEVSLHYLRSSCWLSPLVRRCTVRPRFACEGASGMLVLGSALRLGLVPHHINNLGITEYEHSEVSSDPKNTTNFPLLCLDLNPKG